MRSTFTKQDIQEIRRYLKTGETPPFTGTNAARDRANWLKRVEGAEVTKNNVLMINNRVVVSQEHVPAVLKMEYYKVELGGLTGAERFYKTLQSRYVGIRFEDVRSFVASQGVAQKMRPALGHRVVRPIRASRPFEVLQLDTTQYGKKFILTAIDLHTRYAWAVMRNSASTSQAVIDMIEEIIKNIGVKPSRIQTDNGPEFEGKLPGWLAEQGIKHIRSLPYRSTSQGAIERFNKTIKHLLARLEQTTGKPTTSEVLQQAVQGYNNTYHTTVKGKPHDLIEGNEKPAKSSTKPDPEPTPKIERNDYVRVALNALETDVRKNKARKGYAQQYSDEIYRVYSVGKPRKDSLVARTYLLSLNGRILRTPFYRAQLLKIPGPEPEGPNPAPPSAWIRT